MTSSLVVDANEPSSIEADYKEDAFSRSTKESVLRFAQTLASRDVTELSQWPILAVVNDKRLSKIKRACVFGGGTEIIFITADDNVDAFGTNTNGCLGLGKDHSSGSTKPRKIESLCQKKVKDIKYGSGPHVIAITSDGEVYSWGHNAHGQLGLGDVEQRFTPEIVAKGLTGVKVVETACGASHSMALTQDGKVFAWGYNANGQIGDGTIDNQPSPVQVMSSIGTLAIRSVACGANFSVALVDTGELFAWGLNEAGQLGNGTTTNSSNPIKPKDLQGITISQVVCGSNHTLALSDRGELYAWGLNNQGQLGTGDIIAKHTPTKVDSKMGRFLEIAAIHSKDTSAAMSETCEVYMWGLCGGQAVTKPMPTRFALVDDVFNRCSAPFVSWRMYTVDSKMANLATAFADSFNKQTYSDVTFLVQGEEIYCHKAILQIRCEHLRTMLKPEWKETNEECEHLRTTFQPEWKETNEESSSGSLRIKIKHFSYKVYKAFLKYLYTDDIDLEPEEAIDLLDLSNAYFEEVLKTKCESLICKGITVDNAAMLYERAVRFRAMHLEEFCFQFIMSHMTKVTQTDGYRKMDDMTSKDLILRASKSAAFKE